MIRLKVIAISSNTNSFGLRNQIFIPGNTNNDVFTFFVRQNFELGALFQHQPTQELVEKVFPDLVNAY